MRGTTHTALGAAVALPIAASSHSLAVGLGCLGLSVVGASLPDWLDFRSDLRAPFRLRHRGVSHGVPLLAFGVVAFWLALRFLTRTVLDSGFVQLHIAPQTITLWTAALAIGAASHILADACTRAGIQPLLPFSRWKLWLLPRGFRVRYDGAFDLLIRAISITILAFALVALLARWFDLD